MSVQLQWLHSLEKPAVFHANRTSDFLELTTDDEWNHAPTGNKPADAGTHGSSATAMFESTWFRGRDVLKSSNWPFVPCTDVITKNKPRKFAPETEMMKKETEETTIFTAHVTIDASTFEWQKFSYYKNLNLLCIVAYMLRILAKFRVNRTNIGSITVPEELSEAEL